MKDKGGMKNEEEWKMKGGRWYMTDDRWLTDWPTDGQMNDQTNRHCDCRVAFTTENHWI